MKRGLPFSCLLILICSTCPGWAASLPVVEFNGRQLGGTLAGDLAISTRFLGGTYGLANEPLDIAVTVTNRGGSPVGPTTVRISNLLPGGLSFERISTSQGVCRIDGGILKCELGGMESHTSASIQFGSQSAASGQVVFEATATSETVDPLPDNNAATNTILVRFPGFYVSGNHPVFEGDSIDLTIWLSEPLTRSLTIPFATTDGSAVAGSDYLGTNGSITFAPGVTTNILRITTLHDGNSIERDEYLDVLIPVPWMEHGTGARISVFDIDAPRAPYFDDFETGVLSPAHWITVTPNFAQLISNGQPHSGIYELGLVPRLGVPTVATLRLNVSNLTNLSLRFWARLGTGSPDSAGFGGLTVDLSVDGVNAIPVFSVTRLTALTASLASDYRLFVVLLDPVFEHYPLKPSGILKLNISNYANFVTLQPGGPGGPGTLYDHSVYIDDIQVTGCPRDGVTLISPQARNGTFQFQFQTCAGQSYEIESKHALSDPQWGLMRTVAGDGLIQKIELPLGDQQPHFYRVRTF